MLAGRHFDPDRGVRFCTYAAWWIEAQLRRYLRRQVPVVRVPEGTQLIAGRLRRAEEKLLQQHHRVTLEMVAAEAGVNMATAELAVSSPTAAPLSLDQPANYPESELTLQDRVADASSEQAFDQAEHEVMLRPLLRALDPRAT